MPPLGGIFARNDRVCAILQRALFLIFCNFFQGKASAIDLRHLTDDDKGLVVDAQNFFPEAEQHPPG